MVFDLYSRLMSPQEAAGEGSSGSRAVECPRFGLTSYYVHI